MVKVVPLWKGKGNPKHSPESFHPISILPVVSKLVEMTVKSQIASYMETSRQWSSNNQAYKIHMNTTTTLLSLSDRIFEACEDKEISITITIDESAAFDCVSFKILLEKLTLYNFDKKMIKWMESYLTRRTQFVVIGASESKMVPIQHGVPQGLVLGPTLYNLYINKMVDVINDHEECKEEVHKDNRNLLKDNCKVCGILPAYVDDATYLYSSKDRDANQRRVIEILERLRRFLNSNQLTINRVKTILLETMLPQRRTITNGEAPTIKTKDDKNRDKTVKTSPKAILLGGMFHQSASWRAHIETGEEALLPKIR